MRGRTIFIAIVLISLVMVCGLCVLTGYGTYAWLDNSGVKWALFHYAHTSAEVIDNLTLDEKPVLEIELGVGDITVQAADTEVIEVKITKTAWASNEAEAREAAEAITIKVEEQRDTLKLTYNPPEVVGVVISQGGSDRVDLFVQVPMETSVVLESAGGKIELTGIHGDAELRGRFNPITVTNLSGALLVTNNNGDITLTNIHADRADIQVHTKFGNIHARNISGVDIDLVTRNGELLVQELDAEGSVSVDNDFGRIDLQGIFARSLSVESSNGHIKIGEGEISDSLFVSSGFSDLEVYGVRAMSYSLGTSNGDITLNDAGGSLKLKSEFGGINVLYAEEAVLDLKTSNGRISFSGSLDETQMHFLENRFGDIILVIPSDSAFDVVLKTEFGAIASDIPITIEGELSEDTWVGTMNGGGELLKATTSNGDIRITVLE